MFACKDVFARRSLGALAIVMLLPFAAPARAADFEVENLRIDLGGFSLTIPKASVKGSPLERDAFLAIFDPAASDSAVARIERLEAAEITAPTIVQHWTIGSGTQTTTYRNVSLRDIRGGVIGGGIIESAGAEMKTVSPNAPGGTSSDLWGRTRFERMELGNATRILSGPSTVDAVIFGSFEQDAYRLQGSHIGTLSFGASRSTNFVLKAGPDALGPLLQRMGALSSQLETEKDPESPAYKAASAEVGKLTLTLMERVELGNGEVSGMNAAMTVPAQEGQPARKVDFSATRLSYGNLAPEKSGVALEGIKVATAEGSGKLDLLSLSGFSFGPMLRQISATLDKPDLDPAAIDPRSFIPGLGTIRLSGLSFEVPQGSPETMQPALKGGLGLFELKAGEQLNGIPTALTLVLDNLSLPVVAGPSNPAARDLLAMGYKTVDLSAKIDLAWQERSSEIAIRSLSLSGTDMAKLEITGTLGNVGKDVFSPDLAVAQVAALGATARGLDLRLQNLGLAEKLVQNEARKAKRKPEDLRREYGMIASIGLASVLGPSEAAKTLAAAVARFVARPGTLSLEARPKSPSGIGLADVIVLGDATEILDKIELKATAE